MISWAMFALAALSVCDCATNAIADRIVGVDPAVSLARFSDYPPSRGRLGFPRCLFQDPFPVNEKFWLRDVDFSCVSPWNEGHENVRAGTLISLRHVIYAGHFPLMHRTRLSFVDREGDVCVRRLVASKGVSGCDIEIGLLDEEVSPSICPAKILPEDFVSFIGDGMGLPVITFNQREEAFLSELGVLSTNAHSRAVVNRRAQAATWKPFGGLVVRGDSGNPAFLLIGNKAILLYCLYSGGVGNGPSVFHWRREIQATMDALCPGYRLTAFDFAALGTEP